MDTSKEEIVNLRKQITRVQGRHTEMDISCTVL